VAGTQDATVTMILTLQQVLSARLRGALTCAIQEIRMRRERLASVLLSQTVMQAVTVDAHKNSLLPALWFYK
jgi:hypothetical protein